MNLFILTRPVKVVTKRNGIEHTEEISSILAGPLFGDPDEVELEARRALIRTGERSSGAAVTDADLEGLDVSGGLRDAYQQAIGRSRHAVAAIEAENSK